MKCKFCGNEVEKGAKFCPVCGTEVMQENENADSEQSGDQFETSDNQAGYSYHYNQSDNNQEGYSYGQSEGNQGGYSYGQPNSNQGGYSYGQSDGNQGGYSYGQSDSSQGGYGYGQPENNQGSYGYGQSGNDQGSYTYDQNNFNQPNGGYGQPNYSQPNYGQPVEQISSTPYLIFAILTTLCCCLPFGIASIVYASKINSLQRMGDYAGAKDAAKKAKIFSIVSAIGGVIAAIILGVTGMDDVLDELDYRGSELGTSIVSEPLEDDKEEKDNASAAPVQASEDLGDSWKSYTVQINDVVLTFPCSLDEVEATGLVLDTENTPEDYVINKDDYEWVFFEDDNYHSLMFLVSNNTEEAHVVRECTVNGVYVDDYDTEDGSIRVIFPGDIQMGSDIDKVIEKWGEPDDVFEGDYSDSYQWYDNENYNYCMVSTEPGEKKVVTIDLEGHELK